MTTSDLRRPFFVAAVALAATVVLVEAGAPAWLSAFVRSASGEDARAVGHGIAYLALVDGLVLWTVLLMGASLVVPERLHGRVQGVATLLVSLAVLLGAIALVFVALGLLILMVTLLTAAPFGTVVYFATYADFPTTAAAATLGLLLALKLACGACLLAAHQRMVQNRGLVGLLLTAWLAHVVVGFLHAFVPGFLASITDALAAIVVAVVAAVWALVLLLGSIVPVVKALRLDRA